MSNIFQQIKDQTSLLEVIAFYTEDELRACGDKWYEMSDKSCPFCGHSDCFKVHSDGEDSNYHCFSCEAHGDQITFVAQYVPLKEKLEVEELDPAEAVKRIAKDFNVKLVIRRLSPSERLLGIAAQYYHNRLLDSKDLLATKIQDKEVSLTPFDYQVKKRHHKVGTLVDFNIGYTDGELCSYLQSTGESLEEIQASGLGRVGDDNKLYDFYPKGLFTYPHYVEGICSHLTQKDVTKAIKFQLGGKYRLNEVLFFNQDSMRGRDKVYLVEGENDVLSLYDAKADGAVLGTDGSISSKQVEWLKNNLKGKAQVVTVFDADQAGDKYRLKILEALPEAIHIRVPEETNDVDNFLATNTIQDLSAYQVVLTRKPEVGAVQDEQKPAAPSVSVSQYDADTNLLERNGCYYRIKLDKDGNDIPVPLTDFTIKVRNIYQVDGKRHREITITRCDGYSSAPILMDSETKVSLKAFRSKVADAVDGCYYGSEVDLINLWRYVYKKSPERIVDIPDHVGDLSYDGKRSGWLFRNIYIKPTGEAVQMDPSGVMWMNGNTKGIRPRSISADLEKDLYSQKSGAIPALTDSLSAEVIEGTERLFITNFVQNIGDVGQAMLMLGWAKMCAHSSDIYDAHGSVPFMFAWGGNGSGKTTILWWLLSLYGMEECGYATLPNLGSAVGFTRKMAYYSSLPMCVDEIRVSQEMHTIAGKLRSWYNRTQSDMAATGSQTQIHERPVRSTLIFGGQDMFTDPALRERCIVVRLAKEGREMDSSYNTIQMLDDDDKLSSIGFQWIQEALRSNSKDLMREIQATSRKFSEAKVSNRTAWTWGIIGTFSLQLCRKYYPDFDLGSYLLTACLEDSSVQKDNSSLNTFFEVIEGLMSKEFSPFSCEHFRVDKNKLYFWFPEVCRTVKLERTDNTEEKFSKDALRVALMEEPYFLGASPARMGNDNLNKRVLILDIAHEACPDSLKNIAEVARGF